MDQSDNNDAKRNQPQSGYQEQSGYQGIRQNSQQPGGVTQNPLDSLKLAYERGWCEASRGPGVSQIEYWLQSAIPCHYVRFQQAVPPAVNKEPVSEFRLEATGDSQRGKLYVVDSIYYTPHGVIFKAYGETNIVPLANVMYVRTNSR